jgi:predicted RNA polymerase sigma factor
LTQGFPDRSIRIYAALEVLEPEDLQYKRALALAYLRAGRAQDSLSALDRLAQRGGIDEGFHFVRSQVLAGLDRHEEAAAAMRAYLELKP